MNWFDKLLYFVLFPLVCIGAIISPLTNDVRIFTGVEYLAWHYFSFPHGISYVWEIKPIMNHIINYGLVVFASTIVPFQNHFAQEIIIKTVAVAVAIFASWLFSRNILKIKYGFLLCFIGMFASLNLNVLQAEWWGVVLSFIAASLFVENRAWLHYIAGALFILIFLTKGTTAALIVSAICIVLIVNDRKIDWVRGGAGFIITGLLFGIAAFTIWPEMISDIILAPILSHVGEYHMLGQVYVTLVAIGISFSIYTPLLGIGAVYGGAWLNKRRKDPRVIPFILMWLAPLIVVWIQSESFAYQYFLFVPSAIMSLVLYETETPKERPGKKLKRENLVVATIVILFVMWCFLYSPLGKYGVEESNMNNFFWNDATKINNGFDLKNQREVLYLDTGSLPYYFGINTSCRYVAPLVIQRGNPNRTVVMDLPQYHEEVGCILNYTGKYILADGELGPGESWFGNDTVEKREIITKIKSEYFVAHTGAWNIYERRNESEI